MTVFGRVLFPTDFSAYANAVFACLPELESAGLREVVLLGIIRQTEVPLPESVNRDSLERVRWGREEALNVARMALEGRGLRVLTRVEYGSPASTIVRVAEEERVGLIFMESQGRSIAGEALYGSLTQTTLRNATVPVLVQKSQTVREVGRDRCQELCRRMSSRVLYPTDLSPPAEAAFRLAKRLKAAGTREVHVLYVQPKTAKRPEKREARTDAMCRALLMNGIEPYPTTCAGDPSRVVLEVADKIQADLILVGLDALPLFHRNSNEDVFDGIVRSCTQPVLVVTQRMNVV